MGLWGGVCLNGTASLSHIIFHFGSAESRTERTRLCGVCQIIKAVRWNIISRQYRHVCQIIVQTLRFLYYSSLFITCYSNSSAKICRGILGCFLCCCVLSNNSKQKIKATIKINYIDWFRCKNEPRELQVEIHAQLFGPKTSIPNKKDA